MAKPHIKTGGCLCGTVRFQLSGPARGVVNCHCGQCVKNHGHYVGFSNCAADDLEWSGSEHITWYHASPTARRGFCCLCGSSLIWEIEGGDRTSIAAGAFDQPSGLKTIGNIFVADKPDYYDISDGLPVFQQGDDGTL